MLTFTCIIEIKTAKDHSCNSLPGGYSAGLHSLTSSALRILYSAITGSNTRTQDPRTHIAEKLQET